MDSVLLVAPRPIRIPFLPRIASPFRPDTDSVLSRARSPAASPLLHSRSPSASATLPSEALEEFFSILRPSFLPSTSPSIGKARRSLTIPSFQQYERPLALRPRQRLEIRPDLEEPSDAHLTASSSSDATWNEHQDSVNEFYERDSSPNRRFRFGPLSSPVSRLHTRNPFIKQLSEASALAVRALSPAAIPLPTPTPDEWQTLQDA